MAPLRALKATLAVAMLTVALLVRDAGVVLSLNNEIQAIEDVMEARWISQSVT